MVMVTSPGFAFAKLGAGDTITTRGGVKLAILQERSTEMKVIAQALLFNLECSTGDAFRVGAGLEGDYFLPKLASVHGTYINTYFNLQKMSAGSDNKSLNGIKGFSLLEVGGRFHLLDRQRRARHKIVLSSSTSYSLGQTETTEHYLKAKLPCRRILAVRGGFYRSSAPVSTNMNKDELSVGEFGGVRTKDGAVFANTYFTNSYTTGFYVGLSDIMNMSVRTRNNVLDYSGYTYFSSLFREVYADVILASTSFDPFLTTGQSHEIEADAAGSFHTSKIGWRVGKKIIFTRKTLNMGFSFELGNRPGVAGRGLFFGTGVSLAFVK